MAHCVSARNESVVIQGTADNIRYCDKIERAGLFIRFAEAGWWLPQGTADNIRYGDKIGRAGLFIRFNEAKRWCIQGTADNIRYCDKIEMSHIVRYGPQGELMEWIIWFCQLLCILQ